jgi:hypothetical protein
LQVRDNIEVVVPFLEFSLNGKVPSMTTPLTDDALELAVELLADDTAGSFDIAVQPRVRA